MSKPEAVMQAIENLSRRERPHPAAASSIARGILPRRRQTSVTVPMLSAVTENLVVRGGRGR